MKGSRDDAIAMVDDSNSYPPLREEEHDQERAACHILLSLSCGGSSSSNSGEEAAGTAAAPPCNKHRRRRHRRGRDDDTFECRTCGRQFATFQALGGHRTSHLRRSPASKLRPKAVAVVHACGTCGLGFSTGQALGGHMRRHRGPTTTTAEDSTYVGPQILPCSASSSLQLLNLFV